MSLADGGHLSHGSPVSLVGKLFHIVSYGVRKDTERIDYDQVAELARTEHPKLIVAGASAYPRIIDFPRFREIADSVGALLMVDMAHIAGLVATGVHPSPVPYADFVTTTTHKTLRGPRGGIILYKEKYAKQLNSAVFPGSQGGPLEHVIAAKAVALKQAASPEFAAYQKQVLANARALAQALTERRLSHRFRRHRHSPHACRSDLQGSYRQRSPGACGDRRHHSSTRMPSPSIPCRQTGQVEYDLGLQP